MKKTVMVLLSVLLIALVLVVGSTRLGGNALAQSPGKQVVVLRCSVSAPVSSIPIVMSSSGSAGAPVVIRGTTCAQALADLLSDGFGIQTVESAGRDNDTDLYYTLASSNP